MSPNNNIDRCWEVKIMTPAGSNEVGLMSCYVHSNMWTNLFRSLLPTNQTFPGSVRQYDIGLNYNGSYKDITSAYKMKIVHRGPSGWLMISAAMLCSSQHPAYLKAHPWLVRLCGRCCPFSAQSWLEAMCHLSCTPYMNSLAASNIELPFYLINSGGRYIMHYDATRAF